MSTKQLGQDSRSQVSCKYYLRGNCSNGTECVYAHPEKADEVFDEAQADVTNLENEEDDFSREIFGSFARFEDGGRISKLLLACEHAAVRMIGLPGNSSQASISTLLRGVGFEVNEQCIQLRSAKEAATVNAVIQIEDPSLPKEICARLTSELKSNRMYSEFGAVPIPGKPPSWSITRRVNCNKIHLSWHKLTLPAWLNFGNGDIAKRASEKFNRGAYTILGQAVSADEPRRSGFRRGHNPVAWSVTLKDVPINASANDISDAIKAEYDKPRHVELPKRHTLCNPSEIPAFVTSLLEGIGPVDFEIRPQSQGKRTKAVARFKEEADAREAARTLNDKPQDFLNGAKLTVQLVCSSKFKISTSIYNIMKERLSIQAKQSRDRHVVINFYSNATSATPFVNVKIEGEDGKEVASAANSVEAIVAGKTMFDGDDPLWNPTIASGRAVLLYLKGIQQQHGVVIIRDKTKRQLRFFGPDEKYELIQQILTESLKTEPVPARNVELDDDTFIWVCNGGFKQITTALGPDVASLDIVSRPRRIVVTGLEKQYQIALNILQGKTESSQPTPLPDGDKDCSICWTEVDQPVVTSCGHLYCIECIENLCMAAASPEKAFLICCQGDMGKCEKALPLPELQKLLSSAAFEDILEASFRSYIGRHPQEFRYCPTPDCGYIYRATSTASKHTCPKCLVVICTGCHQQHGTMTCAEYKDLNSGGYEAFRKYKEEMGIKDCPKCTTSMEKTEGCNHMTCRGCGAHVCWVCLKTFSESGPCYAHMTAQHGGIGTGLEHLQLMW